jgi:hypothetical protein
VNTVPCRTCGSGCLAEEPPDTCNNCDPAVQVLLQQAVDAHVSEVDEILLGIPSSLAPGAPKEKA